MPGFAMGRHIFKNKENKMLDVCSDFPGKNMKTVCTIYNFFRKLASTQKFKMANLNILQSSFQEVNNNYEIEEKKCCM